MHGIVAQFDGGQFEVIDDDKYVIFVDDNDFHDFGFIVFRKVKIDKDKKIN